MRLKISPYLLLTATALFWGSNFVVGRALSAEIPPIAITFWRSVGALAVLLPFTMGPVWHHRRALAASWPLLLILGLTGVSVFHGAVYLALSSTTAINAALFMALTPLAILLLAYMINGEALNWRQIAGICLSFVGVLVLVGRGDLSVLRELRFNRGDLWMIVAFMFWAFYSVLLKRRPVELPPIVLVAVIMFVGVVFLIPAYIWEYGQVGGFALSLQGLAGLAFLAVFASALGYLFWNRGVGEVGAARAGPFMHLVPIFATILAIVFLGEKLFLFHLAGAAMIALGVIAASGLRSQSIQKDSSMSQ